MGFASLLLDDNVIPDSDPKRSGIASEKSKMHRKIRIIACTPSPRMALGVGLARPMSRNICWLCLTGFGSPWRYHVSKQFTICYKRIHSVLKTESRNERGDSNRRRRGPPNETRTACYWEWQSTNCPQGGHRGSSIYSGCCDTPPRA